MSAKLARVLRRLPEDQHAAAGRTLLFWAERAASAAAVSACMPLLLTLVEVLDASCSGAVNDRSLASSHDDAYL